MHPKQCTLSGNEEVERGVLCVNGLAFDVAQREMLRGKDRRRLTPKRVMLRRMGARRSTRSMGDET